MQLSRNRIVLKIITYKLILLIDGCFQAESGPEKTKVGFNLFNMHGWAKRST